MHAASVSFQWYQTNGTGLAVDPAAIVEATLSASDADLDYGGARLTFDRLVDPSRSVADVAAQIDHMTQAVRKLAGSSATPDATIAALRRFLYVDGPWNDGRAFAYDHADPLGQRIENKLLATYFATRRGNCVSMPALFLILADRLGLDVALVTAPLHIFLRYRSESGRIVNIEASNGGHPTRDAWYREQMPMSDRAVESGLYLRSLSKREGLALLATTVLEHLIARRRFEAALAVSTIILRHAPRDGYTMVKQGSVYAGMIEAEFGARYPTAALIPPPQKARYDMLLRQNRAAFEAAEALGWEQIA
ncbi:transglutaminase family protein [uncultured Sphingomonas sp.]|uniref:transglutaminase family protein n=1 Tax=uncultured Sphingomonas sp. TaxID=158754 RepID=UPI0035CBA2AC